MAWPSPQDYNEAVQNPAFAFFDDQLRCAAPELNSLGLPKPRCGNFASVYRLLSAGSDFAVRCFLHPVIDQEFRYEAMEQHVSKIETPYMFRFDFISEGIRVGSQRCPIIKMEWGNGQPLNEFVQSNLHDSKAINAVAEEFRKTILLMQSQGIAHGDLQHGNILITEGRTMFVDYDGMFVPALAGLPSNELGHRNYQHPARTAHDYHELLDNFSAWLIYISLSLVAEDPSVWKQLRGGDECLLWRRADLEQPLRSGVFSILESHACAKVRVYARFLRSLLAKTIMDVPCLDATIEEPGNLAQLLDWLTETDSCITQSVSTMVGDPTQATGFHGLAAANKAAPPASNAKGASSAPPAASKAAQPISPTVSTLELAMRAHINAQLAKQQSASQQSSTVQPISASSSGAASSVYEYAGPMPAPARSSLERSRIQRGEVALTFSQGNQSAGLLPCKNLPQSRLQQSALILSQGPVSQVLVVISFVVCAPILIFFMFVLMARVP